MISESTSASDSTAPDTGSQNMASDSTVSDDNTTLTEVLAGYAAAGFVSSFSVADGAMVECHECGVESPASTIKMTSLRRLEGASDPDDMSAVIALTCPNCERAGTLILGFGPAAPPEDGDVLRDLRDFRDDDSVSGNSAPGETVSD
jgi:hypothetical protein